MKHKCHATDCNVDIPPKMLMCLKHWRMVPPVLQRAVWEHYRPGQEIDKKPTAEYLIVQKCAVLYVAIKEKRIDDRAGTAELMASLPEKYLRALKAGSPQADR